MTHVSRTSFLPSVPALAGWIVFAAPLAAQPEAPHDPTPLAVGEVVVWSGPEACDGEECWVLEVTCPELVEAAEVTLRVGAAEGELRGTVLFMSGGGGTGLWGGSGPARGALEEIRRPGSGPCSSCGRRFG